MKGVFAFLLFSVVLLAVLIMPVRKPVDLTQSIFVEKLYYSDLDFKNSVRQCFSLSNVSKAINCLKDFEGFFEGKKLREGVSADVWVGFVTQSDVELLKQKMLSEGKALKCSNCFDLGVVFEGLSVLNAFLSFEGRVVVSSSGLVLFSKQAGDLFFKHFGKRSFIGASFYGGGIAVVSTIGEGFK